MMDGALQSPQTWASNGSLSCPPLGLGASGLLWVPWPLPPHGTLSGVIRKGWLGGCALAGFGVAEKVVLFMELEKPWSLGVSQWTTASRLGEGWAAGRGAWSECHECGRRYSAQPLPCSLTADLEDRKSSASFLSCPVETRVMLVSSLDPLHPVKGNTTSQQAVGISCLVTEMCLGVGLSSLPIRQILGRAGAGLTQQLLWNGTDHIVLLTPHSFGAPGGPLPCAWQPAS